MRKLFALILLTLALTSCSQKFYTTTALVDVRPYTERGFFITQSNSLPFEYESVGIVFGTAYSGDYKGPQNGNYKSGGMFGSYRAATISDALYALYTRALNEGADGVINLKHEVIVDKKSDKVVHTSVSGMAIKKIK